MSNSQSGDRLSVVRSDLHLLGRDDSVEDLLALTVPAGPASGGGSADVVLVNPCPADLDGDDIVSVTDLVEVILGWGCTAPPACPGDVNGDLAVDVSDLVEVILGWGPCS